jgi:hypothetical protein
MGHNSAVSDRNAGAELCQRCRLSRRVSIALDSDRTAPRLRLYECRTARSKTRFLTAGAGRRVGRSLTNATPLTRRQAPQRAIALTPPRLNEGHMGDLTLADFDPCASSIFLRNGNSPLDARNPLRCVAFCDPTCGFPSLQEQGTRRAHVSAELHGSHLANLEATAFSDGPSERGASEFQPGDYPHQGPGPAGAPCAPAVFSCGFTLPDWAWPA